jgi:glutathione S-transferase
VGLAASVEDRFSVMVSAVYGPADAKEAALAKEKPEAAKFLEQLAKLIAANGGWLVGGAASFADVIVFDYIRQLDPLFGTVAVKDGNAALKAWYDQVAAIPGIAAYLAAQKPQ